MTDSTLDDIRSMLAAIAKSIVRLPELRPAQFTVEQISAIGDLLRACDSLLQALTASGAQDSQVDGLLGDLRAYRRLLFLVFAAADPDRAVTWTEAHRESERTADAQTAAGLLPRYFADQASEASLRARWLGGDDE